MSKKKTSKKVTKPVVAEKLEVKEVIEGKAEEVKEKIESQPTEEIKKEKTVLEENAELKEINVKEKKLTKNQWIIGSLGAIIVVLIVTIVVILVNQPKVATEVKCRVFGNQVQYSLGTKWVNAGDVDEMKENDLTNDGTQEADNPVKIIVRGQGSETEVEKVTYSGGYSRPSSSGGSSSGGSSVGQEGQDIEWSGDVGTE